MAKVKLKVCGMREPGNITAVASLRPDFIGFIFHPASPRYVGEQLDLPPHYLPGIPRVGVFVNAARANVLLAAERFSLEFLQLHGQETPEEAEFFKTRGFKIIKAFAVDDDFDFEKTAPYVPFCDFFLFDTKGKNPGGNGVVFNWEVLGGYGYDVPFFLSGGLTPENISGIGGRHFPKLFALDINSGVEQMPGVKDPVKVKKVIDVLDSMSVK